MVEGAIRLNLFGLERGKTWQAILMALAVCLPLLVWGAWNQLLVPDKERLPAGEKISLTATPQPMAPTATGNVLITIPESGWSLDSGDTTASRVTLLHSQMVVDVTAVSGAEDLQLLFERKKREINDDKPTLFATGTKQYTTDANLSGVWGNLTGERYGGALIVVGQEDVAAVVELTAPLGELNGERDDMTQLLNSMRVTR